LAPPTILTIGITWSTTLTLAVEEPQAPKKLQSERPNANKYPFDSNPPAIVSWGVVSRPAVPATDNVFRRTFRLEMLVAFVLINEIFTELQALPPDPVDEPKPIVSESQEPIDNGDVIWTVGSVGLLGATTLICLELLTADHLLHVEML
jgi:hypothetical protein